MILVLKYSVDRQTVSVHQINNRFILESTMMSDRVSQSIQSALAELHNERARIDSAILELQNCLESLNHLGIDATENLGIYLGQRRPRSTAGWTSEARHAAAERMRRFWATRREQRGEMDVSPEMIKKRSTKGWTTEARRAAAERMRRYWQSRQDTNGQQNEVTN
jgi:hypothetical protein